MTGAAVRAAALAAALVSGGCAAYSWRPAVPPEMRTAAVATFRNESDVTELGSKVTAQVLRELQREGTFRVAAADDAAVEVQGVVKSGSPKTVAYERHTGARLRERELEATAVVSFIDKKAGQVIADGLRYKARTTFLAGDDVLSGARDASGRLAEELARQIVDDLVSRKWQRREQ